MGGSPPSLAQACAAPGQTESALLQGSSVLAFNSRVTSDDHLRNSSREGCAEPDLLSRVGPVPGMGWPLTLASPTPSSCVNQELEVPKEPFFPFLANLLISSQWWRDIFTIPSPAVVFSLPGPYPSEALEGNQRQLGSRCHVAVWGPRVPSEGRLFGGLPLVMLCTGSAASIKDSRVHLL